MSVVTRGRVAIFVVACQIGHQYKAAITIAAFDKAVVAHLHIDKRVSQGAAAAIAGDAVLDNGDFLGRQFGGTGDRNGMTRRHF